MLLGEIETLSASGRLNEAIHKAEETRGPVAAILLAGLRRVEERHTGSDVVKAISTTGSIELAGQVEPSLVAGGIKVALITTATGLAIAIPVSVSYNFFVTRIDQLVADMEEGAQAVLDLIWQIDSTRGLPATQAESEEADRCRC